MADDLTARHPEHDLEVVAAFAATEATESEATHARALIERCAECAALARDLAAISASVRALPSAERVAINASAPRDFRLSGEQAARLRGGSGLRSWLGAIGVAIATFGRPMGASLAAMGVVGILVGSMSLGSAGAPALGPGAGGNLSGGGQGAEEGSGSNGVDAGNEPAPASTSTNDRNLQASLAPVTLATTVPEAAATITPTPGTALQFDATSEGSSGPSWILLGSMGLVIGGLVLLLIAERARRRSR